MLDHNTEEPIDRLLRGVLRELARLDHRPLVADRRLVSEGAARDIDPCVTPGFLYHLALLKDFEVARNSDLLAQNFRLLPDHRTGCHRY
jgi:hypothetical protein